MPEDRTDAEKLADLLEEERTRTFGSPEIRSERQREYILKLMESHSEDLIWTLLVALSGLDDFIPAWSLKKADLRSVRLEDVIRRYDLPWFYFEAISERRDGSVQADVSHGINMAAQSETFVFAREGRGLTLIERRSRWIS